MSESLENLNSGNERDEKGAKFKEKLLQIEEKYSAFFKQRPDKLKIHQHDRLHNHHVQFTSNGREGFAFLNDSDLPEYIKRDCYHEFEKIYKSD